ncbi:MAG: hypothetical protein MJK15_07720 [Colwellia sp.]|nr:hypothetical protein [Colwellia sp.]
MSKTTSNLIRLVKAGGNLTINVKGKTTDNIIRIAQEAVLQESKISFTGLNGKTTENLIRIIKAGGAFVHIDL